MNKASKNYIGQYKLLFYASWAVIYFIFPIWRFTELYFSPTKTVIPMPVSPQLCLLIYFFIVSYLLNSYFKNMPIEHPMSFQPSNWIKSIKNNYWLLGIYCIAAVLHAYTISPLHVISPHSATDRISLWNYGFLNQHWHDLFDFPIQYVSWLILVVLVFLIIKISRSSFITDYLSPEHSDRRSNLFTKLLPISVITGFFLIYTNLYPYYDPSYHPFYVVGEAPFGTVLYLGLYFLLGTGIPYLAPLIIQFTFYILSGIFIFKSINLFYEKEPALLGASIYLFSPIIFSYATLAHLASGVVFFIIIVSYFFLKFLRDGNNEDLLLTAYFTAVGSLYKREVILLFIICSAYLIVRNFRQKNPHLKKHLKVLSLSLMTFLPWYFIGTRGADHMVLSHLIKPEYLFSYLSMIPAQISWPVFLLFLVSIIFIVSFQRTHLSVFFGLAFPLYYVLYTLLSQQTVHRYTMVFYPAISIFLALFLWSIIKKIKWKHAFKLVYSISIIYLAVLCIIPRSSTDLITFKYRDFENQRFPDYKAAEWIINETQSDEKVLILYRMPNINTFKDIYSMKTLKDFPMQRIRFLLIGGVTDLLSETKDLNVFRQNLLTFCKNENISYIYFAGGDAITFYPHKPVRELEVRKFLEKDVHDDFILSAKFNIEDNYIYIYKIRDK